MGNETINYQLNQWEATDDFLRTDFNEDNAKIDAALSEKSGLVFGTYTGDGAADRSFDLGFAPKAVYVCTQSGMAGIISGNEQCYGGLALPGYPLKLGSNVAMALSDTGFIISVTSNYIGINRTNMNYYYFAVK